MINISLTSRQYSESVRKAVIHAYERGCNVVSCKLEADGGLNLPDYEFDFPADYDYSMTVCVSGYADDGTLCDGDCAEYYMNYGKGIDVLAPADYYPSLSTNGGYANFLANSGATPHVSGALALLRSSEQFVGIAPRPEDYEWLLKLMSCSPDGNGGCNEVNRYWDEDYGYGLLRLSSASNNAGAAEHLYADGHVFRTYGVMGGEVCDSLFASPQDYAEYTIDFPPLWKNRTYKAQVLRIRASISYPDEFSDTPLVWGLNTGVGASAANPNYGKSYCIVEDGSRSTTGCNLSTYIFRLYDLQTGEFFGWFPHTASNVYLYCRVSGILADRGDNQYRTSNGNVSVVDGTAIEFDCVGAGTITFRVYDVRGRRVHVGERIPVHDGLNRVVWDGRGDSGLAAPSGVYLLTVDGALAVARKRVVLLR